MIFKDALLEICNRYDDDYCTSKIMIEIRIGKTLMLVPFAVNIETDLEDEHGNLAMSIGSLELTDEILKVIKDENI